MIKVEGSSKLCAFCTKCLGYSIPSWIGAGILHRFYSEFLTNSSSISKQIIKVNCKSKKLTKRSINSCMSGGDKDPFPPPPENWTVCGQCLPFIQAALESKENVNKVECQVTKLQIELLKVLQNLVVETDKMCGDLKKIEEIALAKPAEKGGFEDIAAVLVVGGARSSLKKKEENLVGEFKAKIKTVIQDIKVFGKDTSTKIMEDEGPSPRKLGKLNNDKDKNNSLKLIDEVNGVTSSPIISTPSSSVTFENDVEHVLDDDDDSHNLDDQSKSPSSLPDPEHSSNFRVNLIKRINLGRTIATSKNLPLSANDPRHSYSIEHSNSGSDSKFFVQDTEVIVTEEGLQCGTCRFKVEASPFSPSARQPSKRWNIEDKLFEHILSKHLNLYNCPICGETSDTFLTWRSHKQSHSKEKKKGRQISKKKTPKKK